MLVKEVIDMKFKANDYTKGEIVKIIRQWTELTQKDFGDIIGKSKMSIQDYELEKTNYGIDIFLDMARKFNLTITIEKK